MNKRLDIPLPTQTTIGCTLARISKGKNEYLGNDLNDNRPFERDFVYQINPSESVTQHQPLMFISSAISMTVLLSLTEVKINK